MVMVMVMMVMMAMMITIIIITLVTIGDHFMPHLRVSCSMRVPLKPPARSASAFPAWTCLFFNLEFVLKILNWISFLTALRQNLPNKLPPV